MPHGITVVGLGPGDADLITRQVWNTLEQSGEIWLRTGRHPAVPDLPSNLTVATFDQLYDRFDDVYQAYESIIESMLELGGREQGVIYGVPGDPLIGEATVEGIIQHAPAYGLPLDIQHGVSFVEPCLRLAEADGLDGLVLADALDVAGRHHPPFPPDLPILIGQLYSPDVAADVKLCLLNQYPEDHPVLLIHGASMSNAAVESLPLGAIDQSEGIGAMTALLIRPAADHTSFESFQETVAHLRAPNGCPWDREQTHLSLRQHLLDETYEALDALDRGSVDDLCEELGDLMLQLVIQIQIATEAGEFKMADVISGINQKLIRRHPHVFGDVDVESVSEVLHNWEALKEKERKDDGTAAGSLDGVPASLPALAQALEYQARAGRLGFDWPDVEGVLAKIDEEIEEVRAEAPGEAQAAEMGDLFFALVNLARWLEIDPEAELRQANRRFKQRFGKVEMAARSRGESLTEMDIDSLEALWQAAKREEGL